LHSLKHRGRRRPEGLAVERGQYLAAQQRASRLLRPRAPRLGDLADRRLRSGGIGARPSTPPRSIRCLRRCSCTASTCSSAARSRVELSGEVVVASQA
jgi:hypothetical protein